jgi:hypothetical protein
MVMGRYFSVDYKLYSGSSKEQNLQQVHQLMQHTEEDMETYSSIAMDKN